MFINFILVTAAINSNADIQQHLRKISYEKYQVEFEYEYREEGEDTTRRENGILSVNKNQYRINLQTQDIICNNTTIWNFDKNSNTVNIIKKVDEDDNPLLLLMNYKKIFQPRDYIKKGDFYIITMIPKEENDYDIKYLEILCNDHFIHQLNIFNEDGSWMTIRFSKWNTKINFTKSFFSFDPKKQNAKVVNLD